MNITMAEIEVIKKRRTVLRTLNTKLINKIESYFSENFNDPNVTVLNKIAILNEFEEQLLTKASELKELDRQIAMKTPDADLEAEIIASEELQEKIVHYKCKIKGSVQLISNVIVSAKSAVSETSKHELVSNSQMQNCSLECDSKIVLPKLSIKPYSGDPCFWIEFFNQFKNSIDKNKSLTDIEKFLYLKQLLIGNAANAIAGFTLSSENYKAAIELLEKRFGRTDLVINAHITKLLSLEPVKNIHNLVGLRKLYDECEIQIRNLKSLDVASGTFGQILCPILIKIIPEQLALEFNRIRKSNKFDIEELMDFLRSEIECRETSTVICSSASSKYVYEDKRNFKNNNRVVSNVFSNDKKCLFCAKAHESTLCTDVNNEQKRDKIISDGLCIKCLKRGHKINKCWSKFINCKKCKSNKHCTATCGINFRSDCVSQTQTIVSNSHCKVKDSNVVLLQTSLVIAKSNFNSKVARLLLDSGSEKSFINNSLAAELRLPVLRKEKLTVFAFGADQGLEKEYNLYKVKLCSKMNPKKFIFVEVLGTDFITATTLKAPNCDPEVYNYVRNKKWKLADPSTNECEINILLGADYFWRVQRGIIEEINENLYVANTIFGFTVVGRTNAKSDQIVSQFVSVSESENFDLQKFWDLESLGITDKMDEKFSQGDLDALNYFKENINFVNGRYVTKLLWKDNNKNLKSNFNVAKRRLLKLGEKLDKELFDEYEKIFNEQCNLGIIEEVDLHDMDQNMYYMPHRPIVRKDKSTSKVRIVFDASSKEKNENSLNDCLFAGPNLNPNILDIILRFRIHQVAFVSDIEKAFLQIGIADEDRDFLRFLWFNELDINSPNFKVFRMCRVSFGVTSSPFILAGVIKHHIQGYKDLFHKVVSMLDTSLYVDDLFYGAESVDEAFILSTGAVKILRDANMQLRKFKSNSTELKNLWKEHGINIEENIDVRNISKILGIIWESERDTLKVDVHPILEGFENRTVTKRLVLQTAAKIYDPIGLISPFVIKIKFLMQSIWELGTDWDSVLPENLTVEFQKWVREVKDVDSLEIPRNYFVNTRKLIPEMTQIFVFCDASLKGYGSVAYFRNLDFLETAFIMSKTRVAPLKKITLPRLELLGALTAARLANYLMKLFSIPMKNMFCYCDSQIVLHWVKGSSFKWKPFVANRVREIQDHIAPTQWKFCPGSENPADILSRGCSAVDLLNNDVWVKGPAWLNKEMIPDFASENKMSLPDEEILVEQRKTIVCSVTQEKPEFEIIHKFSSWTKLKRVMAYCLRFIKNIRCPSDRNTGFLTVSELEESTSVIIKLVQEHEYLEEIKILKSDKSLKTSSKLLPLNPFIDKKGILRVGGRLRNANLSENQKHQMILPKKHHVTDLIIKYFHESHLHGGTQLTISSIRQKFWIINAREAVKKNIRRCMKCFRNTANLASQLMGDLPPARVTQARVFSRVGADLAGPFLIKPRKGRGIRTYKCYVCLYVCFATKAIHLEVLSDLTTDAFLASLKRFVARRGKPHDIFSDRGTNFQGADKELKRMLVQISSDENLHRYLANEGVRWNFNPPSAPHFGGLWEAGIKQMKAHLKKTIGQQILTLEEFLTLIAQIESCLNSRPLVPISNDAQDLSVLTPGHFIIGDALTSLPEPDVSSAKFSPLERWKLLQKIFQCFWKRWSVDYLSQLQQRSKWQKSKVDLKLNDLVLIKDDNLPPLKWRLGRVIEVFSGKDNKVRVVTLRTSHGELKRPIAKLAPLPVNFT